MAGRLIVLGFLLTALTGCECGKREEPQARLSSVELPEGFDGVMRDHASLGVIARDALIQGDLRRAQQTMRKLTFFMEHTPYPDSGTELARVTQQLAAQVRGARDVEEASMAFARLSHACGQCHHALDRGPPTRLDPVPQGPDITTHMRRHYWAVERMWEALLANSPPTFQRAARVLAEAPLQGEDVPAAETPAGATRLGYEVHDLAFAAAVEGNDAADDYMPKAGERGADRPTTRGQAEIFGQLLVTCHQCHQLAGFTPALPPDRADPGRADPDRADPDRADPDRADPDRASKERL